MGEKGEGRREKGEGLPDPIPPPLSPLPYSP